jgi:hypothetical protein
MGADSCDRLVRLLVAPRRELLAIAGALLATLLAPLSRPAADVAASGSTAIVGGGGRKRNGGRHRHRHHRRRRRRDHRKHRPDPPPDPPPSPPPPCLPGSREVLCVGRCGQSVPDGCGGLIDCGCEPESLCLPLAGVCCPAPRLCAANTVCCQVGETCAPDNTCCPPERLCLPSGRCCPAGEVCAPGGGVCCPPVRICTVGGVLNACCDSVAGCVGGVCA